MSSKERRMLILVLGSLAALGPMSIDLYLPAFPLLEAEFSTTSAAVSGTMAAYFAGIAVGQLIYGPVSDSYGRRTPLIIGLVLYSVGALMCAAAPSIDALVAARAIQALGGCAGMVICRAVVRDLFPPEEMAQVFSSLLLVMGLAPILAPSVGAFVVDWSGWRVLFLLMALFSSLCLVGTLKQIPKEPASSTQKISLTGSFQTYAQLLGHRVFLAYSLSSMFIRCGLFAYITGSPFLYQKVFELSSKQFGLLFGINAAGFVLASQVNGRLAVKFGHERVYRWALLASVVTSLPLLSLGWGEQGSLTLVESCLFLFIASLGFLFPCATAGALEEQPNRAGSASALNGLMGSVAAAATAMGVGHLQALTSMAVPLLVGVSCLLAWVSFAVVRSQNET